jgi:hypothetical protein
MLAADVLEAIADEGQAGQDEAQGAEKANQRKRPNTVKKFDDAGALEQETFSDFIPLKTYA